MSLLKSDLFDRALPWTNLIFRNGGFINDLNLRFSSRVSVVFACALPAAFAGALWRAESVALARVFLVSLLLLNASLYLFFLRKRGPLFAFKAVCWHLFYYFYGGLAFFAGAAGYFFSRSENSGTSFKVLKNHSDSKKGFAP